MTWGGARLGNWAMGRVGMATAPARMVRRAQTVAKIGRPMKKSTNMGAGSNRFRALENEPSVQQRGGREQVRSAYKPSPHLGRARPWNVRGVIAQTPFWAETGTRSARSPKRPSQTGLPSSGGDGGSIQEELGSRNDDPISGLDPFDAHVVVAHDLAKAERPLPRHQRAVLVFRDKREVQTAVARNRQDRDHGPLVHVPDDPGSD